MSVSEPLADNSYMIAWFSVKWVSTKPCNARNVRSFAAAVVNLTLPAMVAKSGVWETASKRSR